MDQPFDVTAEDLSERMTVDLLAGDQPGFIPRPTDPLSVGSILEAHVSTERFGRQIRQLEAVGLPCPAVVEEGSRWVPVLLGPEWWSDQRVPPELVRPLLDHARRIIADVAERSAVRYDELTAFESADAFKNGLRDFLSTALTALQGLWGSSGANLSCEVHTQRGGLTVYQSPSHLRPLQWTGFAAPTTPVKGSLPPGKYVFGGQGPNVRFRYDQHPWDVTQAHNVVTLNSV